MRLVSGSIAALLCGLLSTAAGAQGARAPRSTLARVRATKALVCGVNAEVGDYSRSDDHGAREAFDRDLCEAVAVAILGAGGKVVIRLFPDDQTGMDALRTGAVDLLPTLTVDFTHATHTGIGFSGVALWDGVGFMVPADSGVQRTEDLSGRTICLLDGTEVEESVRAWFRRKALEFNPFPFQEEGEMEAAFVTGGCAAISGDQTRLAATRVGFGAIAAKFRMLPEVVSKDPLAAASLRESEGDFGEIVDWVLQVLLAAEEAGISSASIKAGTTGRAMAGDMTVGRLAGRTHELGARLGLADDWAIHVVEAVGNYGEIYRRDLGDGSAMNMVRGWNRLARDGGLMAGLPIK